MSFSLSLFLSLVCPCTLLAVYSMRQTNGSFFIPFICSPICCLSPFRTTLRWFRPIWSFPMQSLESFTQCLHCSVDSWSSKVIFLVGGSGCTTLTWTCTHWKPTWSMSLMVWSCTAREVRLFRFQLDSWEKESPRATAPQPLENSLWTLLIWSTIICGETPLSWLAWSCFSY